MKHVKVTWIDAAKHLGNAFNQQSMIELPIEDSDSYWVAKCHAKPRGKWFELRGNSSNAQIQTDPGSDTVDIYFYPRR